MTKYTFKIETEDIEELDDFKNAQKNSNIVWQLKHNFGRKFKHEDGSEDYIKGINKVLDELEDFINSYLDNE